MNCKDCPYRYLNLEGGCKKNSNKYHSHSTQCLKLATWPSSAGLSSFKVWLCFDPELKPTPKFGEIVEII